MNRFLHLVILLAAALWGQRSLAGSTNTVSTTLDVVNNLDGVISLREALITANITPSSNASPNVIYVPAGTYSITNGELAFGNNLNLNTQIIGLGSPTNTVIKQTDGKNRVFDVNFYVFNNVSASIQNVTITGGVGGVFGGGGVLAGGLGNSLLISNCVISGNTALSTCNGAGISWGGGGNLTIHSCVISNNVSTNAIGGGLCFNNALGNPGNLVITNSIIQTNTATAGLGAGLGGGLYIALDNTSSAAISHSAFLNNMAPASGGAIYTAGGTSGNVNIQWCRLVTNSATTGSGLFNLSSTVSATNNWWGNNFGPGLAVSGSVATNAWLKLTHYPASSVNLGGSTVLTASFLTNSANASVAASHLGALVGLPVVFNNPTNGTLSGAQSSIQSSGTATAQFTPSKVAIASADATVDSVTATANVNILAPVITATVTGGGTICAGDSSTVTVTITGGVPPYIVNLNAGGFKTNNSPVVFTVSPSITTNCQVLSVTDSNGYTGSIVGSALVTVNPLPVATLTVPTNVYISSLGNQASGPSGMATYVWSITNGVITSAVNGQTITFNAGSSGNVGLSLTVANSSGCTASGSTNIGIVPVPFAVVTLNNLVQTYDGNPKSVSAVTVPAGLIVNITYNGSSSAPINMGSYTVIGRINATNYQGSATNTLVIAPPVPRIPNPSFESNSFSIFPGYCSTNGSIIGWTGSDPARTGLNPAAGSPFADNGAIPQGNNVAFIQTVSNTNSLSTIITNLLPGFTYRVTCRVNGRSATGVPTMWLALNGAMTTPRVVSPVLTTTPYSFASGTFVATSNSAPLTVYSTSVGDGALLVDDFNIIIIPSALWTYAPWTNDSSTAVDPKYTRCAYRFGSVTNALVNGVTFTGLTNISPSVPGVFTLTGESALFVNSANNLTALGGMGSAELGRTFIYGGNPAILTLLGLTTGQSYRLSLFGVGYDNQGQREALFSAGGDQLYADEDTFGKGNGIRVDYTFVANATNNVITVSPLLSSATFHLHAFALNATPLSFITVVNVSTNRIGFSFGGAINQIIVVEAATNLVNPVWQPLQTNTLGATNAVYFTDPASGQFPGRFYRLRTP